MKPVTQVQWNRSKKAWAVVAILALNLLLIFLVSKLVSPAHITVDAALGDQTEEVRLVQQALQESGQYQGKQDGKFSYSLRRALRQFQKEQKIPRSGEIDAATLEALGISSQGQKSVDAVLLARFIQWKAGKRTYQEQIAAGAVLLNRVQHPAYPDTIAGVLLQDAAFPDATMEILEMRPGEQAQNAARECIQGMDPTGGALIYPD